MSIYDPHADIVDPGLMTSLQRANLIAHRLVLIAVSNGVTSCCVLYSVVMCSGVGCIVVNVEYRLAPEYPFPAGIDDGCTVAQWVLQHKTLLGKQALLTKFRVCG